MALAIGTRLGFHESTSVPSNLGIGEVGLTLKREVAIYQDPEGDALVAETVGLREETWLDTSGHPHSDALRLTERFYRTDFGYMQIEFIVDDPKIYEKPWSATVHFDLAPDTELIENICENEKDATLIERVQMK
jgi:hypothetical protein